MAGNDLTPQAFHKWAIEPGMFWRGFVDLVGVPELPPSSEQEPQSPLVRLEAVVYFGGYYYRVSYSSRLDQAWSGDRQMLSYSKIRGERNAGDGWLSVDQLIEAWGTIPYWDADILSVVMAESKGGLTHFETFSEYSPLILLHLLRMYDGLAQDMATNTNGVDVLPGGAQVELLSQTQQELLNSLRHIE